MSVDNKDQMLRDPFYTSPLPRTFYHPSPARDVDVNAVMQIPERRDIPSEKSDTESPFETGTTFRLSALPQFRSIMEKSGRSPGHLSSMSVDTEQLSNSTLLNTTHLTSSIDDKEVISTTEDIWHHRGESLGQDGSTSVLQKYINRFRYSAPKSREEREKEKAAGKQNTCWWLHSDSPHLLNREVMTKKHRDTSSSATRPLPSAYLQSDSISKPDGGVKLTREAIMELDKETSDLQQKADKILSKSQLSLTSSGLCVSTEGLGSSTGLSECSYRTDPQTPYRPIFVNLQGEYQKERVMPVASVEKLTRIEEQPTSPQDVLARWRMRKKMGETRQLKNSQVSTKPKLMKNHSEMDVRLEEFRKKLLVQRAQITSEDIQFERQKMKMLISDDEEKEEIQPKKIENQQESISQTNERIIPPGDIILSRLRKITSAIDPPQSGNLSRNDNRNGSAFQHEFGYNQEIGSATMENGTKGFNSNNANISRQHPNGFNLNSQSGIDDRPALNTNNTALNRLESQGNDDYRIDEMISVSVCDAKQSSFSLNSKNTDSINDTERMRSVDENIHTEKSKDLSEDMNYNENISLHSNQGVKVFADVNEENSSPNSNTNQPALGDVTHYHQRLQAEKPCDDSDNRSDRSTKSQHSHKFHNTQSENNHHNQYGSSRSEGHESENSVSSKQSERSVKKTKHKTTVKKNKQYLNDEELSDTSSKHSDRSSVKASKSSRNNQSASENIKNQVRNARGNNVQSFSTEKEDKNTPAEHIDSRPKRKKDQPIPVERVHTSLSKSTQQNKIHKVIGETVVDHLFDGPSMISSVDSWASLFPQSPSHSHSFYNSTVVTPTKDALSSSSNRQIVTHTPPGHYNMSSSSSSTPPQHQQITTSTPHSENAAVVNSSPPHVTEGEADSPDNDYDSCEEFEKDPLMSLLLQQKKEYLRKLKLIEFKLQTLDDEAS